MRESTRGSPPAGSSGPRGAGPSSRAKPDRDTIAAVATAPGECAIAIVRVSGPKATQVVDRVFQGSTPLGESRSHTVQHGTLQSGTGDSVDDVLVLLMREPRSYTGEDVVEINCHGGPVVTQMVLRSVLDAGARLARPGEFTERAFLNGRMDLLQAEGVAELIRARSELAARAALRQVTGGPSRAAGSLRDSLTRALALVEAGIDFAEEDPGTVTGKELEDLLADLEGQLERQLAFCRQGAVWRKGVRIAIVGLPNTGKSTYFNAVLGEERAIVAHSPGTTRDFLDAEVILDGVPVTLVDTAGLRDTHDPVEAEGVRRTMACVEASDVAVFLVDGTGEDAEEDLPWLGRVMAETKTLVAVNKVDAGLRLDLEPVTHQVGEGRVHLLSAKEGIGTLEATKAARDLVYAAGKGGADEIFMATERHQELFTKALGSVKRARGNARETGRAGGLELAAADLREGIDCTREILGEITTDDILQEIFSVFCIGK